MKKVTRNEIKSRQDYEKGREEFRKLIMPMKSDRRVHVGEYLTFLFENHDTILYQIQEMIRAESTEDDAQILHEMETYNELVGERGELGCTLLIEIDDQAKRDVLLAKWLDLPKHLYVKTQDGEKIPAIFDSRQVGERRISSVHYLKFRTGDKIPVAVGCSHPELTIESALKPNQSAALCKDLIG